MADDIDADLIDLDPTDIDSIVRWSRARQFQSRHKPEPQPKQTDAEASRQWTEYVDARIMTFLDETMDILARGAQK